LRNLDDEHRREMLTQLDRISERLKRPEGSLDASTAAAG
jgi:hypothetical protein